MLGLISPGSTEADVKLGGNIYLNIYLFKILVKHLFNSQLCQEYFCQKLLKYANLSSSYDR